VASTSTARARCGALAVGALLGLSCLLAPGAGAAAAERHAAWAQPLALPGAPNLHKVTDSLYRGAQPTAAGMRNLARLGVRTVVSLRAFHSDRARLRQTGLGYEHIFMKTWHPEEEDVVRFLKIATDPARAPVFVHCQHGADRTGAMIALYRIVVQGWTKREAIDEMTGGGYGFHAIWTNLPPWIERLDIAALKAKVAHAP
jgi:protein tyrosine phosphatase (PTP) superfamily phosphohydrolase (DUF442 family)